MSQFCPIHAELYAMKGEKELQRIKASSHSEQTQSIVGNTSEKTVNVCPHCMTKNDPDALFCEECGTALMKDSLCPICHHPLDSRADFCEHCKSYISHNRCAICGATMSDGDAYCPQCGTSRQGIRCPACNTLSPFSYCRVCGLPLTQEATKQREKARQDPFCKQIDELARELDNLTKIIPVKDNRHAERNKKNEELCNRVRNILGGNSSTHPEATRPQQDSSEEIAERIIEKRKELQELLDAASTPPQEDPIAARNYLMARKPASVRIGWKCNFKQAIHSSPCGCACPQLGGKWIVLTPTTPVEDDL